MFDPNVIERAATNLSDEFINYVQKENTLLDLKNFKSSYLQLNISYQCKTLPQRLCLAFLF